MFQLIRQQGPADRAVHCGGARPNADWVQAGVSRAVGCNPWLRSILPCTVAMMNKERLVSATFVSPTSTEHSHQVMQGLFELYNDQVLVDFVAKGDATGPGTLFVRGTAAGIAQTTQLLESLPLLVADAICGWCFARESTRVLHHVIESYDITAEICDVCQAEGQEEKLIMWRKVQAKAMASFSG